MLIARFLASGVVKQDFRDRGSLKNRLSRSQAKTNGQAAQGAHETGRLAEAHAGVGETGRAKGREAQKEARKKSPFPRPRRFYRY